MAAGEGKAPTLAAEVWESRIPIASRFPDFGALLVCLSSCLPCNFGAAQTRTELQRCGGHHSVLTNLPCSRVYDKADMMLNVLLPCQKDFISSGAEEHTLPPHEVPVENSSSEKSSDNSVAEVVPEKDAETPAAQDTTSVVEDKSETPEMTASSEKPEEEGSNAATEESNEAEEETIDEKPEIKIETAPADFRFPTTNQTRHCFTRYIEYHRCVAAKGEGAPECEKFAKYYRSLCPSEWIERWNEQRENGTFPGPL
ncbi:hypothetical protein OsJ_25165 [Oryza sativa Japonica Group]|uniref:Cytochrome c oxidase subunit 6b-1 n=1 Tax=Oryza sativa subsp. japonica TaxID=39947 RepID=A3BMA7_ORYSJ|nr:hypothetical protein OsJ_25165 [Oryza sativa Japonica Group]